jgi:hypothetical protein
MKLYLLGYNIFDGAMGEAPAGFTIQAEDDKQAIAITKRILRLSGHLRYAELYDITTDEIRKLEWSQ